MENLNKEDRMVLEGGVKEIVEDINKCEDCQGVKNKCSCPKYTLAWLHRLCENSDELINTIMAINHMNVTPFVFLKRHNTKVFKKMPNYEYEKLIRIALRWGAKLKIEREKYIKTLPKNEQEQINEYLHGK